MSDAPREDPLAGAHLIACGHGTRSLAGQRVMARLVETIGALRGAPVHGASVDVQEPSADDVAARLPADRPGVIVPLLLSAGYHTSVDLRHAAERYGAGQKGPWTGEDESLTSGAASPSTGEDGPRMLVAAALGPSRVLAELQRRRLLEAGWAPGEPVVLGVAGSSMRIGRDAAEEQRALLEEVLGQPVSLGYGAAARPTVAEAVAQARTEAEEGVVAESREAVGTRVACASYLLAPGNFQDRLQASGADCVAAPLLLEEDPQGMELVADLSLQRAREALAAAEQSSSGD